MRREPYDVVVIDDAPEVRSVVVTELRLSHRFVVVAEGVSGADAVALAARHQPAMVVLDVSMAGMDGIEALPSILDASPSTKVVLLSGFDSPSLAARARTLGAADYVEKGAPIAELPGRLLRVLGVADRESSSPRREELDPRRRGDTVLAEHLEGFRTAFEQAAIGMATLTNAGRIVRVNSALARIFDEDESALVGRRYVDLAAPEHRILVADAVDAAAAGAEDAVEAEHNLAGGHDRWVRSSLAPVRDPSGRPLYLFAQADDITRRRAALDTLRASEERFRLLVEGVRDYAIFMLDPHGRVSTWNLGAERMKGYTAEEIIGQHFRAFYDSAARDVAHPEHELKIAVRDGRYEEEGWRVRKDGTRFWANVVITALFGPAGELAGFAKVTRDITERRAAAMAREQAAAELEAANRELTNAWEKTTEFVAVTAHELQSPIAAMTGAADILARYWDDLDAGERTEALRNITAGGTRIRRLLGDLLTTSRLEAGSFQLNLDRVDVRGAITAGLAESSASAGDVEVRTAEAVTAWADRSRLTQIVTNLVANAQKYGRPPIVVEALQLDTTVEIRVRDSGEGVQEELVPRLFDKFVRGGDRSDAGTGLGLYIVRELARAQGGSAWYERDEQAQPCFVVRLPAGA